MNKPRVAEWVRLPLVPVTLIEYGPGATQGWSIREIAEFTEPPAGGTTGSVSKARFRPEGTPEADRLTGEEKAPTEVIVAVVVVDTLSGIVMVDGEIVIVKSGDCPDDTTVKVKTVEWVSVPFDPDTMSG
jgi:hypothetical protein